MFKTIRFLDRKSFHRENAPSYFLTLFIHGMKGLNGVHCLLNQQVVCCIQTIFIIYII